MERPQIPYKIMLKRLHDASYNNEIETGRARRILTYIFRMPRPNVFPILNEMMKLGLIHFETHNRIRIVYIPR